MSTLQAPMDGFFNTISGDGYIAQILNQYSHSGFTIGNGKSDQAGSNERNASWDSKPAGERLRAEPQNHCKNNCSERHENDIEEVPNQEGNKRNYNYKNRSLEQFGVAHSHRSIPSRSLGPTLWWSVWLQRGAVSATSWDRLEKNGWNRR